MSFLDKWLFTQLVNRIYSLPNMKLYCHVHNRLLFGYPKPEQPNSQFHTIFIEDSPYFSSSHLPIGKKELLRPRNRQKDDN